jgi:hypothetical protein
MELNEQAEQELRGALRQARRWGRARGLDHPAPAAGEEMPINDVLAVIYILRATLAARLGVDLAHAERLLRWAGRRVKRLRLGKRAVVDSPLSTERDIRSSFHEARALLRLAQRNIPDCVRECERSLVAAPRASAWLLLARACLAGAEDGALDEAPARARARAALDRAGETDRRGALTEELAQLASQLATCRPGPCAATCPGRP